MAKEDLNLTLLVLAVPCRIKLFSFTQKEVLGTAQAIKMFAEWAPKTELFRRSKRMRDGEEAKGIHHRPTCTYICSRQSDMLAADYSAVSAALCPHPGSSGVK